MVFLLLHAVGLFVSQDLIGHDFLLSLLEGFLPTVGAELVQEIKRLAGEEAVQWTALGAFLWFGLLVFVEVDYAVNVVFETSRQRHPLMSTAIAFALLGLMNVLFTLSFLATQALNLLARHAPRIRGLDTMTIVAHHFMLSYMLPFALLVIAVTGLYRYLPKSRPPWRHAVGGGVLMALLWKFAKHVFSLYIQSLGIYSLMYGSLGDVIFSV